MINKRQCDEPPQQMADGEDTRYHNRDYINAISLLCRPALGCRGFWNVHQVSSLIVLFGGNKHLYHVARMDSFA